MWRSVHAVTTPRYRPWPKNVTSASKASPQPQVEQEIPEKLLPPSLTRKSSVDLRRDVFGNFLREPAPPVGKTRTDLTSKAPPRHLRRAQPQSPPPSNILRVAPDLVCTSPFPCPERHQKNLSRIFAISNVERPMPKQTALSFKLGGVQRRHRNIYVKRKSLLLGTGASAGYSSTGHPHTCIHGETFNTHRR